MRPTAMMIITGLSAMSLVPPAYGVPDKLITATPGDAVAALYLQADAPGGQQRTPAETMASAIGRLREMGILGHLDGEWRVALDLLHCWPVIHRYPRAYILHDLKFRTLETGSNRLAGLSMSLVLRAEGDQPELQQLVQHFLSRYSNKQSGRIEPVDIEGRTFHRLVDASFPDWLVWEWGRIDDFFVVSVGPGAGSRVARCLLQDEANLLSESWFAKAHLEAKGPSADLELYVDMKTLQQRLGEGARHRLGDMIEALGVAKTQKSVWTVGAVGRAVRCYAYHRHNDADRLVVVSDPAGNEESIVKMVPEGATRFAIIRQDAADLFRRLRSCYLATHRLEKRYDLLEAWRELAKSKGVDVEQEILSQLGDRIIVHDYPEHPLKLPPMVTILVEIDGDSRRVSQAVERILEYCSIRMELAATKEGRPLINPLIHKSHDGLWYLQWGVYGPAVAVTEGWLVLSFSPEALRANLAPARSPDGP